MEKKGNTKSMHTLIAKGLCKRIKKNNIIQNISIELKSGEIVGLLGPNGAGKTTTFYIICGLVEADCGEVFLDELDITKKPLHQRANLGIGYLPQESSIFKDLSVEDNLFIAAELAYEKKEEQEKRVDELLELLNIEPIRYTKGLSLSGGERRRVEIARALIKRPKFLLLDEPFAGVDPIAVADIEQIIKELSKLGIGILITDHNVREMLNVCDRGYVLKDGSLLASGDAKSLGENELVRRYYLGESFRL